MRTIGVLGTGDMGSAVGRVMRKAGFRVVTALDGRSPASRSLAVAAQLEDLGSLDRVLAVCDAFFSILPPAEALDFAREASSLVRHRQRPLIYADCNAVAPATVRTIAGLFSYTEVRFLDVGIVGPAPKAGAGSPTRFYVAGAARTELMQAAPAEIRWIDMGDTPGRASAIKMCYAAMNKGVDAMYTNILLAAMRLGVDRELLDEFASSQPEAQLRMTSRIPYLAATAQRYAGEMGEIAMTLESAGLSGDFHRGAQWLYALLAKSDLATETRATLPPERSLDEALRVFAASLADRANGSAVHGES